MSFVGFGAGGMRTQMSVVGGKGAVLVVLAVRIVAADNVAVAVVAADIVAARTPVVGDGETAAVAVDGAPAVGDAAAAVATVKCRECVL